MPPHKKKNQKTKTKQKREKKLFGGAGSLEGSFVNLWSIPANDYKSTSLQKKKKNSKTMIIIVRVICHILVTLLFLWAKLPMEYYILKSTSS